jgi:exopolysaccharide biosynthesis polyprenyl glycosylphosphotransferase
MTVKLAIVEGFATASAVLATLTLGPSVARDAGGPMLGVQAAAMGTCCIVAFYYNDLYDLRVVPSFGRFVQALPPALGLALGLLAVLHLLSPGLRIPAGAYVTALLTVVGLVLPVRAAAYQLMRSRPLGERVLILGACPLADKLVTEIEAQPHRQHYVVGYVDGAAELGSPLLRYRHLGPLSDLDRIIRLAGPDRIVVTPAARRSRLPVEPLLEHRVRGIVVEDGIDAYERLTGKLAIESLAPKSLIFGRGFRRARFSRLLRRGVSLVASVAGLLVLAPFLGLIALAIKLDSRGPVLFVQDRVGLAGRRFRFYKFRTMHPAREGRSEWARDSGDRITRVGRWLRRYRLDELPQFVNVVRGDMNLVGPRPHPVTNFELFVQHIPYYSLRSVVPPGITGWAQVRYSYANNLEEETEKMRYDLYFIKHMSLWLDARILFDTVKIVLLGRESVPDAHRAEQGRREPAGGLPTAERVILHTAESVAALLEAGPASAGSRVPDGRGIGDLKAD